MGWLTMISWLLIVLSLTSVAIEYSDLHVEHAVTDELTKPYQTSSEKQKTAIALPSQSATDALLKQSIFSASRSVEPAIDNSSEPTEHTIFLNHYRLSAVAITDNASMVLMTDDKTKKVKHLQLKDELDGWILEDITSTAAVFTKAGQRRRVMLFNAQTPSLATAVATPVMATEQENPSTFVPDNILDDDPYQ